MSKKYYLLPLAVAVCLVFFMVLPATAQQGSQQQGQPGATQSEVSDEDLEKVAEAYVEVMKINKEFQQSVQETQDKTERQELQQEANKDMVQAVEDAGIDVQTYNIIMQQVRTNERTLERFKEFEEKAEGS